MSVLKKEVHLAANPFLAIGIGVATAVAFSFIICGALAGLVISEKITFRITGYATLLIQGTGGLLASWIASAAANQKRTPICLISAAAYFLCLLAVTALVFGGQFGNVMLPLIVIMAGGGIAALSGNRTKNGSKVKALKRRFR